jgi:hypothetical protein
MDYWLGPSQKSKNDSTNRVREKHILKLKHLDDGFASLRRAFQMALKTRLAALEGTIGSRLGA